jgi:hypothetical protein
MEEKALAQDTEIRTMMTCLDQARNRIWARPAFYGDKEGEPRHSDPGDHFVGASRLTARPKEGVAQFSVAPYRPKRPERAHLGVLRNKGWSLELLTSL